MTKTREETKETKVVGFDMKISTHRKLKAYCALHETSMSATLDDIITEYLHNKKFGYSRND